MRALALLLAAAALPAAAHVVSLSTGQLTLGEGGRAELVLRIPLYELPAGERSVEGAYLLPGATLAGRRCGAEGDQLLCTLTFTGVPEPVEVLCRFTETLAANHVHVLTARRGAEVARLVFAGPPRAETLRFGADGAAGAEELLAGTRQAVSGWPRLLFLAALALAIRSRREGLALAAALTAGQAAALFLLPALGLAPAPRFIDAAAALALAYVAIEIVLLPRAGHRWTIVAGVGVLLGLGIPAGSPAPYLAAVLGIPALLTAALGLLRPGARFFARPAAAVLGAAGVVWFAATLWG